MNDDWRETVAAWKRVTDTLRQVRRDWQIGRALNHLCRALDIHPRETPHDLLVLKAMHQLSILMSKDPD